MSDFPRFVIGTVNGLLVLAIIFGTIMGAVSGRQLALYYFGFWGGRSDESEIAAMIFGAAFGFLVPAIPAALLFTLTEIANNTREALAELRRIHHLVDPS